VSDYEPATETDAIGGRSLFAFSQARTNIINAEDENHEENQLDEDPGTQGEATNRRYREVIE
jgi:hypothetical protein